MVFMGVQTCSYSSTDKISSKFVQLCGREFVSSLSRELSPFETKFELSRACDMSPNAHKVGILNMSYAKSNYPIKK